MKLGFRFDTVYDADGVTVPYPRGARGIPAFVKMVAGYFVSIRLPRPVAYATFELVDAQLASYFAGTRAFSSSNQLATMWIRGDVDDLSWGGSAATGARILSSEATSNGVVVSTVTANGASNVSRFSAVTTGRVLMFTTPK